MALEIFDTDVFVNCPFDQDFQPLLEAILFSVTICGFRLRSALEANDSGEVRHDKLCRIIAECRFGIYDISRTEPDPNSGLPRFNMPYELGLFTAAKRFGTGRQKSKVALILEIDKYRYQKFLSDIAGQDIQAYDPQSPVGLAVKIRDWLKSHSTGKIPGPAAVRNNFEQFLTAKPEICKDYDLNLAHGLQFSDLVDVVRG